MARVGKWNVKGRESCAERDVGGHAKHRLQEGGRGFKIMLDKFSCKNGTVSGQQQVACGNTGL